MPRPETVTEEDLAKYEADRKRTWEKNDALLLSDAERAMMNSPETYEAFYASEWLDAQLVLLRARFEHRRSATAMLAEGSGCNAHADPWKIAEDVLAAYIAQFAKGAG